MPSTQKYPTETKHIHEAKAHISKYASPTQKRSNHDQYLSRKKVENNEITPCFNILDQLLSAQYQSGPHRKPLRPKTFLKRQICRRASCCNLFRGNNLGNMRDWLKRSTPVFIFTPQLMWPTYFSDNRAGVATCVPYNYAKCKPMWSQSRNKTDCTPSALLQV